MLCWLVSGCALNPVPDLQRLYETGPLTRDTSAADGVVGTPVILVRHVVFGGDCELTPARLLVEEVNGESMVRLHPDEVTLRMPGVDYEKLMLEPGDGRVTKPSLFAREALDPTVSRHRYSFFPMDHSILLCESHDSLTGNISFQNNLLNILLTQDQPLPEKSMRQQHRCRGARA